MPPASLSPCGGTAELIIRDAAAAEREVAKILKLKRLGTQHRLQDFARQEQSEFGIQRAIRQLVGCYRQWQLKVTSLQFLAQSR